MSPTHRPPPPLTGHSGTDEAPGTAGGLTLRSLWTTPIWWQWRTASRICWIQWLRQTAGAQCGGCGGAGPGPGGQRHWPEGAPGAPPHPGSAQAGPGPLPPHGRAASRPPQEPNTLLPGGLPSFTQAKPDPERGASCEGGQGEPTPHKAGWGVPVRERGGTWCGLPGTWPFLSTGSRPRGPHLSSRSPGQGRPGSTLGPEPGTPSGSSPALQGASGQRQRPGYP